MKIAVLRERADGETRVAATPETVTKLIGLGAEVAIEAGAGELARSMRQLAAKHNIPIVQNKPLARALFREVDYDGYVPEKLYPQIARIMVWVYSMREARRASGRTEDVLVK